MDITECVRFANGNSVAWLATADGNQPRVRPLQMWFADKTGFYFQIMTTKDVYRQLKQNPDVEMAFWKPGEGGGIVLRVAGAIEWVDDPLMKRQCFLDRPFLAAMGLKEDCPELVLFRVAKGEAYTWTFATNLEPKEKIRFGD